jgi:hypothetical protein
MSIFTNLHNPARPAVRSGSPETERSQQRTGHEIRNLLSLGWVVTPRYSNGAPSQNRDRLLCCSLENLGTFQLDNRYFSPRATSAVRVDCNSYVYNNDPICSSFFSYCPAISNRRTMGPDVSVVRSFMGDLGDNRALA